MNKACTGKRDAKFHFVKPKVISDPSTCILSSIINADLCHLPVVLFHSLVALLKRTNGHFFSFSSPENVEKV